MFSKLLTKLIDQAIFPAILILTTRILSVILVSHYLDIRFSLDASGFAFANEADYVTVNSYSTFFMIAVLAVGLFYILLKSYVFHESHISPETTARVFSFKLPYFIQTSFDLYSQGTVWLSYSYLLTIVSGILSFYQFLFGWVFITSFVLSILSTVLLIFDIEHEIKIAKESNTQYELDENFDYLEKNEEPEKWISYIK